MRELLREFLRDAKSRYRQDVEAARKLMEVGEAPTNKNLDIVEAAAFTAYGNALLNLDETITKN